MTNYFKSSFLPIHLLDSAPCPWTHSTIHCQLETYSLVCRNSWSQIVSASTLSQCPDSCTISADLPFIPHKFIDIFTIFLWFLSLPMTYSLSLCCYSIFILKWDLQEEFTNDKKLQKWNLAAFIPVHQGLSWLITGLAAYAATPSSSGWPPWELAATLPLWQRLSFLSVHSFYAQGLLFFKIKDIFPSVHVSSNSQIKFTSLNIHFAT